MVEATIEDLAITTRSSRVTIWGHPHIVGEAVLSTTKIFTGAKPFLKAHMKSFEITEKTTLFQAIYHLSFGRHSGILRTRGNKKYGCPVRAWACL
jgi:hypothetical protein